MVEKINIRARGQMTLPAYARKKLGVEDGVDIYLRETSDGFELVNADKIQDVAAGALSRYAQSHNPDVEEERTWLARSIAETADDYE